MPQQSCPWRDRNADMRFCASVMGVKISYRKAQVECQPGSGAPVVLDVNTWFR